MADTPDSSKDNKPSVTIVPVGGPASSGPNNSPTPITNSVMPTMVNAQKPNAPSISTSMNNSPPPATIAMSNSGNKPLTMATAGAIPSAGKDFQALMKEMQNINQTRTTPVLGGVVNLGAPTPQVAAPRQDGSGNMVNNDDSYYHDDYYAPPPMTPIMKLFFAVQTLLSVIMVALLVMMFNMFSGMRSQAVTADNMKAVLQSFVDGIANQNKALLDSFSAKMDEMGKGLSTLNENTTKTQGSLDIISEKLDKAISRPPVVVSPKAKSVKKAKPPIAPVNISPATPTTPDINTPSNEDDLNNLPSLPSLPDLPTGPQSKKDSILNQGTKTTNYVPQNQFQDNYQLPPLPEPTPNLFPNN